ncbi:16S rRNA (cytosine(967)-C(5))-methyltransferase RsmB [Spongiibacter marinus]|uniref:16S rRNA (cytosine(967)-C(5))-methyltransferase RsmB n=1 Tax=Spongiibacter marinus TaxID=354246 RepID=UPI0035BEA301
MSCPRVAAARCLVAVVDGQSLSRQIPLQEKSLPEKQRPLYRELCYGTLRRYWQLDAALKPCFSKGLKRKDSDIRMLIYIGAYQLFFTRIPPHAAISSAVEACKTLKKKWAAGLCNAILRRCQRDGEALFKDLPADAASAHPAWLYKAITRAWPEQASAVFEANNTHPPMCLRVNQQQHSRDAYLAKLSAADIDATTCQYAPMGLRLSSPCGVEALPEFFAGAVSVQDEAAQLCTRLLELQPGQRVLDACAAPGGKSGAILEAEPALQELVALDIDEGRLERVADNLQRLGLRAHYQVADAADPQAWWDSQAFDRILLDAPCSATGVLRRNPDIRLHRRASDIPELVSLQRRILDAMWQCLAPGGILVYATCSVLPEENEQQIADFLQRHDDAHSAALDVAWGIDRKVGRQLLPSNEGADGFFYAKLVKAAATGH